MIVRFVIDVLRSSDTQSVQVKFFDPGSGLRDKIFADRPTLFRVRINRFAPVGFVFRCKVVAGK